MYPYIKVVLRVNTTKELFLLAERIKTLREQIGITQAELARRVCLTRSSINGWEMGLAIPSTAIVVELAKIFHVTTDYLLGVDVNRSLSLENLSDKKITAIMAIVECLHEG